MRQTLAGLMLTVLALATSGAAQARDRCNDSRPSYCHDSCYTPPVTCEPCHRPSYTPPCCYEPCHRPCYTPPVTCEPCHRTYCEEPCHEPCRRR